ncbi:MAG: DUF3109 family protein [Bacteroidota bacterium]
MRKKPRKHPEIIEIDGKYVSGDVKDEMFACDISACKGACCVEGDLGAPLAKEEVGILEEIYPKVKPFMRKEGIRAIQAQGTSIVDIMNMESTPLVKGKECAYVTFKDGIALCAIEGAYLAGEIDFRKPISCHLYPIRAYTYKEVERLNYDRWSICGAACAKGKKEGVMVYEFVKDALIRKYGEDFYETLDAIVKSQMAEGSSEEPPSAKG